MAHLTCPATVWKYVESAATKSAANLVMLDLEDSIPRGDDAKLAEGRANVIRSFNTLDWGTRLRFFRPRLPIESRCGFALVGSAHNGLDTTRKELTADIFCFPATAGTGLTG